MCIRDRNIPVGEVFTSPVLEGTNGKLHVSQVYLNELNFPVSYTHLHLRLIPKLSEYHPDMQRTDCVQAGAAGRFSFYFPIIPVSYTHLDVYKRQPIFGQR